MIVVEHFLLEHTQIREFVTILNDIARSKLQTERYVYPTVI